MNYKNPLYQLIQGFLSGGGQLLGWVRGKVNASPACVLLPKCAHG